MAARCEICGKAPQYGNRVSHAHNVTHRRFEVNLQRVRAFIGGGFKKLRVCTGCIRNGLVQKVKS